jgi:hypothetical protein
MHKLMRRSAALALSLTAILAFANTGRADDAPTEEVTPPPAPVIIVNVASIDRLTTDLAYLFETIERPDITEYLVGMLAYAGDLKGVDRTRPFGMMVFIDGLSPRPTPVGFIPVSDLNDFIETLSLTQAQITESTTGPNRYVISGEGPEMYMQLQKDYVFIAPDEDLIGRDLPNPQSYNATLTSRYDLSVAVRISNISETVRNVFVTFLRAGTQAELQQRDGEPEAEYLIRRANGVATLEGIEQLLLEGDQILLGLDASAERRTGVLEINVDAVPGSEFAGLLANFAGTPTSFAPLLNESAPLSVSGAWKMSERDQTAARDMATGAQLAIAREEPELGVEGGPIDRLFDAILATIEEGQVDFFAQFATPAPQKFAVIGGLRVVGGQTLGTAIYDLLSTLQEDEDVETMELNLEVHQGVTIHRIQGRNTSPEELRIYGGRPSFYLGTSSRYVWFAYGAEDALTTLRGAIDKMATATPEERNRAGLAPFQVVFHVSPWLDLPQPEDPGEFRQQFRELTEQAFETDNDTLRIESRPTETGIRFRIQVDEGFLKLMALGISTAIDQGI